MPNVIWWLGLSYLCAFSMMAGAVALLSLTHANTHRPIERDRPR